MRPLHRAVALAVLVLFAKTATSALAGAVPQPRENRALTQWLQEWTSEVLRQSVPTPQLLFVHGKLEGDLTADSGMLDLMDGFLSETHGLIDLYPRASLYFRNEWFQEKAALISTNAFVLPSALRGVADEEPLGRNILWIDDGAGELPALHLNSPQEHMRWHGRLFIWAKNKRTPTTLHPAVFTAVQYQNDSFLRGWVFRLPDEDPGAIGVSWLMSCYFGMDDHCR